MTLEKFLGQTTRFVQPVGQSHVVMVSENHVAKVPANWRISYNKPFSHDLENWIEKKQKEFTLNKIAYDAGLSVPRPEGVFNIEIIEPRLSFWTIFRPAIVPAFVMQYIPGCFRYQITGEEKKEADKQLNEQIEKAFALGFQPEDQYGSGNSLWVPKEKRLYLIDLEHWSFEK